MQELEILQNFEEIRGQLRLPLKFLKRDERNTRWKKSLGLVIYG